MTRDEKILQKSGHFLNIFGWPLYYIGAAVDHLANRIPVR